MSKRVYKLFDGSELLVSEESIGLRQSPNALAVTVDGNYVINDVLETVNLLLEDNEYLRSKLADPARGYGDKWKERAIEARVERDQWRSDFHKTFSQRERALEDNDRLRKELEEARKQTEFHRNAAKIYRKATSDIHNTLRWGDTENALERVETIIELAQVQEGEGNQQTLEVTLSNEGYKEHPLKFDEE